MDAPSRPGRDPGDRRPGGARRPPLERPPGERYARPRAPAPRAPEAGAQQMAPPLAIAVLAALAGAGLTVLLGGVLSLTAGLLVVAGGAAWVIGRSVMAAGVAGGRSIRVRRGVAVALAVASVMVGQLGLWAYARSEGGALGPVDYLVQTWGLLVPLQVAVAAVAAWVASR